MTDGPEHFDARADAALAALPAHVDLLNERTETLAAWVGVEEPGCSPITDADMARIEAAGCGWSEQDRPRCRRRHPSNWVFKPCGPKHISANCYLIDNTVFHVRFPLGELPQDLVGQHNLEPVWIVRSAHLAAVLQLKGPAAD